ncbi:hypothetical protein VN24_26060 [Paenibacillus beijingensis]|uniref:Uncharacterized protein n=2 Tax=Paenibacillus beijingensis TaxID=1126833 RepID=A0A0D5NR37_9BACL|nr:hypothetical protein VN24_26060 [Paenibacillus beijingensis]
MVIQFKSILIWDRLLDFLDSDAIIGKYDSDGSFDLILTKPMNPFLNMILKQSYHGFLGHIFLGIFIFVICSPHIGINWSITKVIYFLLAIFGATCIHSAFLLGLEQSALDG